MCADRLDRAAVALKQVKLACFNVPEARRLVAGRGDDAAVVAAPRHVKDGVHVPLPLGLLLHPICFGREVTNTRRAGFRCVGGRGRGRGQPAPLVSFRNCTDDGVAGPVGRQQRDHAVLVHDREQLLASAPCVSSPRAPEPLHVSDSSPCQRRAPARPPVPRLNAQANGGTSPENGVTTGNALSAGLTRSSRYDLSDAAWGDPQKRRRSVSAHRRRSFSALAPSPSSPPSPPRTCSSQRPRPKEHVQVGVPTRRPRRNAARLPWTRWMRRVLLVLPRLRRQRASSSTSYAASVKLHSARRRWRRGRRPERERFVSTQAIQQIHVSYIKKRCVDAEFHAESNESNRVALRARYHARFPAFPRVSPCAFSFVFQERADERRELMRRF